MNIVNSEQLVNTAHLETLGSYGRCIAKRCELRVAVFFFKLGGKSYKLIAIQLRRFGLTWATRLTPSLQEATAP